MPSKPPAARRPRRRSAGYAIGAFVVEIDQRLLRNLPPVEALVAKGDPVRGLSGEPGAFDLGRITVEFPPASDVATATQPGSNAVPTEPSDQEAEPAPPPST